MMYRKAILEDIPLLVDLRIEFLDELNGKQYAKEKELKENISRYFHRHMPDGEFIAWLCINNSDIVGTSGITFYELPPSHNSPNGNIGYIMNMFTKKPFRKHGVASKLFEKMLEEGKKRNVSKYVLNASDEGRKLYGKYGFKISGDEMILTVD